ncbi:hypothetical protein CMV_001629 [Castanea mollissima]|uniref:Uncharacterized protein n=1 Tax=Castanea mollissima TaxID=60419 RepID=A0A8J4RKI5_9ROSI|nr:hypothetical protein CMV_001629 [Castanea mollissima]
MRNQGTGQADHLRRNPLPPPLGVIEVIHAVPKSAQAPRTRRILAVVSAENSAGEHSLEKKLSVKVEQVARGQNRHADSLATLVSSIANVVPRLIRVELVNEPSISVRTGVLQATTDGKYWMDPIIEFLAENRVPEDKKEAARAWHHIEKLRNVLEILT